MSKERGNNKLKSEKWKENRKLKWERSENGSGKEKSLGLYEVKKSGNGKRKGVKRKEKILLL